jgi:hypothetical protein
LSGNDWLVGFLIALNAQLTSSPDANAATQYFKKCMVAMYAWWQWALLEI